MLQTGSRFVSAITVPLLITSLQLFDQSEIFKRIRSITSGAGRVVVPPLTESYHNVRSVHPQLPAAALQFSRVCDTSVAFRLPPQFQWLTEEDWQVPERLEAVRESRRLETLKCEYSSTFVRWLIQR
jgi:hypothetical protein